MAKCIQCGRAMPGFTFGKNGKTCKWCQDYEAAKRGELPEDAVQKIVPPPWVSNPGGISITQILFAINALVFVGMVFAGISPSDPTSQQLLNSGANCGYFVFAGQWWRLLTSVFVHIGIIHIALNMWCLWNLGALAESMYGRWTFLVVYLLCGIAGSLATVTWNPMRVSAGASGAIFGLAGALISSYKLGDFSLPQSIVRSSLRSVVAFAGYNLAFGMFMGRVDNAAHIGGLVAGLILGAMIALLAPTRSNVLPRFTIIVLFSLLLIGAAAWAERTRGYSVHLGRGNDFLQQNEFPGAIRELETAVRQRPNSIETRQALAEAYSGSKQPDKAQAEYQRILRLDPKNETAAYSLGLSYLENKDLGQARKTFEEFLSRNGNSGVGHFGLGVVLSASDDHLAAIKEFETAARLDGELWTVQYQIGTSYAALKKYDEAIAAYHKQISIGDSSDLELALAEAYDAKGMKSQAEDARKKADQLKAQEQKQEQK